MNPTKGQHRDFDLQCDAAGQLVFVDAAGVRHAPVVPVRDFPITDPDHWISICDASGASWRWSTIYRRSSRRRASAGKRPARREFVPQVRRILSVPADTEPTEWEVETDRGRTRFLLNSGDDVRRLGPHRALIVDVQGIRYLIDDTRALDGFSRRIVDRYL